jgi:hypothetical protein
MRKGSTFFCLAPRPATEARSRAPYYHEANPGAARA